MEKLMKQIRDLLYDLKVLIEEKKSTGETNDKLSIYVDMKSMKVNAHGYVRRLTYNESVILSELLMAKDNFCTYEYLIKILYGCELDEFSKKSLITTMSRLRNKLDGQIQIKNIQKTGFKLYDELANN